MKRIGSALIACTMAWTLVSCAGTQGSCRRYRAGTSIARSRVPGPLRELAPIALKGGPGDPEFRDGRERSITAAELKQLRDSLHGRTGDIEQWLVTARKSGSWSAEQCLFRFLLEFYNDMNDLQLMKTLSH
jgi:hypothetical protein